MDLYSGGPHGLYSALYLAAFGGIYAGASLFDSQSRRGQAMIIFIVVLARKMLFAAVPGNIAELSGLLAQRFIGGSLGSAALTALLTPVVFALLRMPLAAQLAEAESEKEREGGMG